MQVVVCTPSRGLIHSRTVEAVLAALDYAALRSDLRRALGPELGGWWVQTHDLPIPDAPNECVAASLRTNADLIWFVEEDMEPPANALTLLWQTMQRQGLDAVGLDYTLDTDPLQNTIGHDGAGQVAWLGLGCTLFRRAVFERLPAPWFRADVVYHLAALDTPLPAQPGYGGHDIWFSRQMAKAGLRLGQVPAAVALAGHLKLRALGRPQTNQGVHTIERLPAPERWH